MVAQVAVLVDAQHHSALRLGRAQQRLPRVRPPEASVQPAGFHVTEERLVRPGRYQRDGIRIAAVRSAQLAHDRVQRRGTAHATDPTPGRSAPPVIPLSTVVNIDSSGR